MIYANFTPVATIIGKVNAQIEENHKCMIEKMADAKIYMNMYK